MKVTDANILIYIYMCVKKVLVVWKIKTHQIQLHNHITLYRIALKVKMLC